MRRTREAIAAPVLAAPVGVERLLERQVGRVDLAEDAFRLVDEQARARIRRLLRRPAVILDLALTWTNYAALITGQPQSLKARLGTVGPRGGAEPEVNKELP